MKKILLLVAFLGGFSLLSAQQTTDEWIRSGIALHDAGKYAEAIAQYKKALAIEPENYWAMYEMAMSYYAMEKEDESVVLLKKILKKSPGQARLESYVLLAAIYDDFGKSRKAYKLYEQASKEYPQEYMVYFNWGITSYRLEKTDEAYSFFQRALELNPSHPTSWLYLAYLDWGRAQKMRAFFAFNSFLFLEPEGKRAEAAYASLLKLLGEDVRKKADGEVEVHLDPKAIGRSEQILFAMNIAAAYQLADSLTKGQAEPFDEFMFVEQIMFDSAPRILEDDASPTSRAVHFFAKLLGSDQLETYCHYISLSQGEEHRDWLKEHEEQYEAFNRWVEEYW